MSWFGAAGCPAPPAAGAAPPGNPPPPGGPCPEGPPGGCPGGSYLFIAFPKAVLTRSSLLGAAIVNPTVSVGAVVVLIFGMSRRSPFRGGRIAFGASGLSLMLWLIAFLIDSSMSSSVLVRLFPFSLLLLLCSS